MDILLDRLPPYEGKKILIKKNQGVPDIMGELLDAHDFFCGDYDLIGYYFNGRDQVSTLQKLFDFLKSNVRYKEETETQQATQSPAAILTRAVCDCKCYALFIGGVLDALNRSGANYNWRYCFASYNAGSAVPGHVFIECDVNGEPYWIDPVLQEFDQQTPQPVKIIRKTKVADMALYRIGMVEDPKPAKVGKVPTMQTSCCVGATPLDWVKENPLLTAAAAAVVVYLLTKKRK